MTTTRDIGSEETQGAGRRIAVALVAALAASLLATAPAAFADEDRDVLNVSVRVLSRASVGVDDGAVTDVAGADSTGAGGAIRVESSEGSPYRLRSAPADLADRGEGPGAGAAVDPHASLDPEEGRTRYVTVEF